MWNPVTPLPGGRCESEELKPFNLQVLSKEKEKSWEMKKMLRDSHRIMLPTRLC